MSHKNNPHIAGRYAVIVALIGLIGTFGAVYLSHILEKNREKERISSEEVKGMFMDNRDGQNYIWIRLKDGKKWMSENLNYNTTDSWCYDNKNSHCAEYGRLYTWEAAMTACPSGWRLPTGKEFEKICNYYAGNSNDWRTNARIAYKALLYGGSSKFSALQGGYYNKGGSIHFPDDFNFISRDGYYWTETENSSYAQILHFDATDNYPLIREFGKSLGLSCRCLQD